MTTYALFLLHPLLSVEQTEFLDSIRTFRYGYLQVTANASARAGNTKSCEAVQGVLVFDQGPCGEAKSADFEEWALCLAGRFELDFFLLCDLRLRLLCAARDEFGKVVASFSDLATAADRLYASLHAGYACSLESLKALPPGNLMDSRGRKIRGELVGIDKTTTDQHFTILTRAQAQ